MHHPQTKLLDDFAFMAAIIGIPDCQVLVPGLADELVVEDSQADDGGGDDEYVLPYAEGYGGAPPSADS